MEHTLTMVEFVFSWWSRSTSTRWMAASYGAQGLGTSSQYTLSPQTQRALISTLWSPTSLTGTTAQHAKQGTHSSPPPGISWRVHGNSNLVWGCRCGEPRPLAMMMRAPFNPLGSVIGLPAPGVPVTADWGQRSGAAAAAAFSRRPRVVATAVVTVAWSKWQLAKAAAASGAVSAAVARIPAADDSAMGETWLKGCDTVGELRDRKQKCR